MIGPVFMELFKEQRLQQYHLNIQILLFEMFNLRTVKKLEFHMFPYIIHNREDLFKIHITVDTES